MTDQHALFLVGGGAALAYFLMTAESKTGSLGVTESPRSTFNVSMEFEEMSLPMNLNINMPSAAFSSLAFTPTPDLRDVVWRHPRADFRDVRLKVAEFHSRERIPLIGGPNVADRNLDEPLRFIRLGMERTPYNEIY